MVKKLALAISILSIMLWIALPLHAEESIFSDVDESFWAADEISYIAQQDIVHGYDDSTFRPANHVNRAQTAAMIARALDLETPRESSQVFHDVDESHAMYDSITAVAEAGIMNGSDGHFRPHEPLTRAQMAVILSGAFQLTAEEEVTFSDIKKSYWAHDAIQNLAANRLTSGHADGSFGPGEKTTRAQFSVFLARAMNESFRVETINQPPSDVDSEREAWHFRGITLGDSLDTLTNVLGEPESIETSRYGFDWYIYHNAYNDYVQFGVQDNKVVAVYCNQDIWSDHYGLGIDDYKEDVSNAYGEPLSYITKNDSHYSVESDTSGTYKGSGRYTTFFYDAHRNHRIMAVLLINSSIEESFDQYYATPTKERKESFERQVFHLANAQRKRYGESVLEWDDTASQTARAHSADMAGNSFFEHTNLDGQSPFDRMSENGITFYNAAENIAYGQVSPIFAHAGWMNSKSHRDSLLGPYERLGVGVAFDEVRKQPYYTQNFYTPM
ncbi:Uncharacterized conserved protein YkwD, contains CAP (CSP/antigen 5/PR1) domain [Alteribacillus persepolensis]|uniref:Uncharacterized conserved protein YkwD, contains CAP (CSP/antigen 5/PR1) domain n=1 Tax=Alteribacillus persepolensis TaxID=568899 RepID=A0A1G8ACR2_9BACI|nr:S-layer homology domain-containing protein [Alteribacillus persepolensis]SDH18738.1 Uncharacterized conserved protein YkwD, contains CAP (CSP/antigen 5/PR1) domain [Alteribacillus persepolensis]